jgi:hypothetical protein
MTDALRPILKNQYHAALAMLREGIERCPASAGSAVRGRADDRGG